MNTTPSEPKPLHIIGLAVQNIMGVKAVNIAPGDANLVVIGGNNGAGKTSTIDSIWWALGGKPNARLPIRKGQAEGSIELDLGDLKVTRRFRTAAKKDGSSEVVSDLKVSNADGAVYQRPQELLDKLLSKVAFDPGEFARRREADQVAAFQAILKVDTSKADQAEAELLEKRKDANREVERLLGRNRGMSFHEDMPDEETSAASLIAELQAANTRNDAGKELYRIANESEASLRVAADYLDNELVALKDLEDQIESAKRSLKVLEDRYEVAQTTFTNHTGQLSAKKTVAAEARQKAIDWVGESTSEIEERIASLDSVNEKVRENKRLAAAVAEYDAAEEVRAQIERDLAAARQARRVQIQAAANTAELPIPGIEVLDGAIWVDGIPFKQCNTETQLRLSVALAVRENPRLRVFRIADGEKITPPNMELLRGIAAAHDAQIWIEMAVTPDDVEKGFREVSVLIEDGSVLGAEEAPVAE